MWVAVLSWTSTSFCLVFHRWKVHRSWDALCPISTLFLLYSCIKCNNIHIDGYVPIMHVTFYCLLSPVLWLLNNLWIQWRKTVWCLRFRIVVFLYEQFLEVMVVVISCISYWLRHLAMRVGEWATSAEEVCRGECSNATQLVASFFNKSSTSASRLFAAARRRTPGNERLHLIRRKWKRNHAQKTPTGGSRRVRYSASVD